MGREEIEQRVIDVVKKHCQFQADKIETDKDLRDNYGIDSILLVDLLIEIEMDFDISIDGNLLTYDNFSTVKEIAEFVMKKLNL